MSKTTQKQLLERILRGTKRHITAAEAREQYGIKNLRARICEMSKDGLSIHRQQMGRVFAYGIARRDAQGKRTSLYTKNNKQKK